MSDSIRRLFDGVRATKDRDPNFSRTARLLRAGPRKIAKKVAEEAAEVALESAAGNRAEVIRESADLLYHLVVLWAEAGVAPEDVFAEMDRRERLYGIAEKPPKKGFSTGQADLDALGLERVAAAKSGTQPVRIDQARRRRVR